MATDKKGMIKFLDDAPAVPADYKPEGYGKEDGLLQTPFLKIIQKSSGEVADLNAPVGSIFSTVHGKVLAKPGEEVLLTFLMTNQDWTKFDSNNQLEWITQDPRDPRLKEEVERDKKIREAEGEEPRNYSDEYDAWFLRMYRSVVAAPLNHELPPAVQMFTLSGKNFKAARVVHSKMRMTGHSPYEMAFGMKTSIVEDKRGPVAVVEFSNPKFLPKDAVKTMKSLFDANLSVMDSFYGQARQIEGEETRLVADQAADDIPF